MNISFFTPCTGRELQYKTKIPGDLPFWEGFLKLNFLDLFHPRSLMDVALCLSMHCTCMVL